MCHYPSLRELASLSKNIQDDEKILDHSRNKKLQTFKKADLIANYSSINCNLENSKI